MYIESRCIVGSMVSAEQHSLCEPLFTVAEVAALSPPPDGREPRHPQPRTVPDREDVAVVAQYAKTYGDGHVWEAACRLLAQTREPGPARPGAVACADALPEWILHEGRRR
jgi:hypothetical protein